MDNTDIGLDRIVLLQTRVYRTLKQDLKPVLKKHHIHVNNWLVLMAVSKLGKQGIAVAEIAETAVISMPQASLAVHALMADDMVKQQQSKHDKRQQLVLITPRGKATLEQIQESLAAISDGYSVAQTATFATLANKIIADFAEARSSSA